MTRSILTRIAAVALATTALAAPTALARPDVTPAAAYAQGARHADTNTNGFPTRPVIDRNPVSASSLNSLAPADHGIDWTTVALGIAGSLIAVGAIAGIASRTRRTAQARITA
jgi:hypothetical protein